MILTFLGAPRTATTSLWIALSNHKNIATSKIKEPWNSLVFSQNKYFEQFKITEDTKILLDGTPCSYHYNWVAMKPVLKDIPMKIIYPIRDPYDRIYSTILQTIVSILKGHKKIKTRSCFPKFIEKNKINKDEIIKHFPIYLDSENLKYAYKFTDDFFIFDFYKLKFNDIFNFLGVESIDLEMPKENTIEQQAGDKILNSKRFKEIKEQLDDLFYKNEQLDYLIKEDRRKLKKKWGIEFEVKMKK